MLRYILIFACFLCLPNTLAAQSELNIDQSKIAILAYGKIGGHNSSLSKETFKKHLAAFENGHLKPISIETVLSAWKNQKTLPENSVLLTFDGGHQSTFEAALKPLEDAGLPFMLFYNPANAKSEGRIKNSSLKVLQKNSKATLGLLINGKAETIHALNSARVWHRKNTGDEIKFIAYERGEYSAATKSTLKNFNITAAFGQASGTAHALHDKLSLPRFTINEAFGSLERLYSISRTYPLLTKDALPNATCTGEDQPSFISFSMPHENSNLSCYMSDIGKIAHQKIGSRIKITLPDTKIEQRLRLNCTAPFQKNDRTYWRWYGILLSDC